MFGDVSEHLSCRVRIYRPRWPEGYGFYFNRHPLAPGVWHLGLGLLVLTNEPR
jgi:hypothetical protein